MKTYYSVSIDKKSWSKDAISIAEFEKRGFSVTDPRHLGDKDVFIDGRKVAILFENKEDAVKFVYNYV